MRTGVDYPIANQFVKIEPAKEVEFENVSWNISKLKNYKKGHAAAIPFTATLTELMNSVVPN